METAKEREMHALLSAHLVFCVDATGADAVDVDEEDEFYEVDDLEEMHTAIINNDFDQVCPPELPV